MHQAQVSSTPHLTPSASHTSLVMWGTDLSLPLDCEISQVSDSPQALILRSSSLPTSQKKIPTTSLHPNPPAICISPFFHHSCPNKGIPSYLRPVPPSVFRFYPFFLLRNSSLHSQPLHPVSMYTCLGLPSNLNQFSFHPTFLSY